MVLFSFQFSVFSFQFSVFSLNVEAQAQDSTAEQTHRGLDDHPKMYALEHRKDT